MKPKGKVAGPVRKQYYVKWVDSSYRNCEWIMDAQAYRLSKERARKFDRVNRHESNVPPQVHKEWSQVLCPFCSVCYIATEVFFVACSTRDIQFGRFEILNPSHSREGSVAPATSGAGGEGSTRRPRGYVESVC